MRMRQLTKSKITWSPFFNTNTYRDHENEKDQVNSHNNLTHNKLQPHNHKNNPTQSSLRESRRTRRHHSASVLNQYQLRKSYSANNANQNNHTHFTTSTTSPSTRTVKFATDAKYKALKPAANTTRTQTMSANHNNLPTKLQQTMLSYQKQKRISMETQSQL